MKCPKCRRYGAIRTGFKVESGRVYKCLACGKVFVRDDGRRKDVGNAK